MDKDSYEKGFQDGHKCCAYEKEKLKAENARYREALKLILEQFPKDYNVRITEIAREALKSGEL